MLLNFEVRYLVMVRKLEADTRSVMPLDVLDTRATMLSLRGVGCASAKSNQNYI